MSTSPLKALASLRKSLSGRSKSSDSFGESAVTAAVEEVSMKTEHNTNLAPRAAESQFSGMNENANGGTGVGKKKKKKSKKKGKKAGQAIPQTTIYENSPPTKAEMSPTAETERTEQEKVNSASGPVNEVEEPQSVAEPVMDQPVPVVIAPKNEKKVSFVDLPIWDEKDSAKIASKMDTSEKEIDEDNREPEMEGKEILSASGDESVERVQEIQLESEEPLSPMQYYGFDEKEPEVVARDFLVSVERLGSVETTIFQNWLRVRSTRDNTWKNRWAMIHNDILYVFPSFDSSRPCSIVVLGQVTIEDCSLTGEDQEVGRHAFVLRARSGKGLYLKADNSQMKKQWMELLAVRTAGRFDIDPSRSKGSTLVKRSKARRKESLTPNGGAKGTVDPSSMFWSIFMLVQVCIQVSMEVAYFIQHGGETRQAPPSPHSPAYSSGSKATRREVPDTPELSSQ